MKKLTTLLLAILWVAAVTAPAEQPDQADIQRLKAEAGEGDPTAQYELGLAHYSGKGVPKDLSEAARWYRAAADQGHADAQHNLGRCYFRGMGVPEDHEEAARWLRAAAEQGHLGALGYLSLVEEALTAVQSLLTAAEQGDADAQYNLGDMYLSAVDVPQDIAQATRWLRAAAESGHTAARMQLAQVYMLGIGVPVDPAEAVRWYRAAAEQGHARAQFILGLRYEEGEGVVKDLAEAARWYRAAGEQGYSDAQIALEALPTDIERLRAEAGEGDATAQYELGLAHYSGAHYSGQGVPKAMAAAARWYRAAAQQGHAKAQYNLGLMYHSGEGVPEDDREAVRWMRAAAEQGMARAKFSLAAAYADGAGDLMRSGAAAAEWYYKAGLAYLKEGQREDALLCVERIIDLQKVHGLTVPNGRVADQLYAAISGADSPPAYVESRQPTGETQPTTFGTGWVVEGGLIVTCYHVIEGLDSIAIRTPNGGNTPATVVVVDPANDLAVLRAEDPTILRSALPVSSRIRTGESVFTIGYPHPDLLGLEAKLTDGIVSAQSGVGGDIRVLQISAPVQAGNSGGPLLNMRGEVVGVVVSKLDAAKVLEMTGDLPENVNYAVKTAYLGPLLASAEPARKVRLLLAAPASLADLASRVEGAVVLVVGR